jgi:hypothetical protein
MNERLLEEKCRLLKTGLQDKLQRRNLLEMSIRGQFEELKKLEAILERTKAIRVKQHA